MKSMFDNCVNLEEIKFKIKFDLVIKTEKHQQEVMLEIM